MTTNNAVNVNLSGQTGTGSFVGSVSPTLTTPTLGVITATSINFGGTALANYVQGTWTPIDASGAGLALVSVSGSYTRIGNIVIAIGEAIYPATANGLGAAIGGLPFANGGAGKSGGTLVYSNTPADYIFMGPGLTTGTFQSRATGASVTNAQMTGSTNYFQFIYAL